jgi:hypothetical protein
LGDAQHRSDTGIVVDRDEPGSFAMKELPGCDTTPSVPGTLLKIIENAPEFPSRTIRSQLSAVLTWFYIPEVQIRGDAFKKFSHFRPPFIQQPLPCRLENTHTESSDCSEVLFGELVRKLAIHLLIEPDTVTFVDEQAEVGY